MRKCNHDHEDHYKQCFICRTKDALKKRKRGRDRRNKDAASYLKKNPWIRVYHSSKNRALEKNLEFSLTKEYIKSLFIKNDGYCPVLKTQINKDNPLSIDRIDSNLGYTNSNIRLISFRANTLKNNATIEELELILLDAKSLA